MRGDRSHEPRYQTIPRRGLTTRFLRLKCLFMTKKRAEKIEKAATQFQRWRLMLALTQAEAAERLGKSKRAIQAYEQIDPKTGRAVSPDYAARVLMEMMQKGMTIPAPWPVEK